MGLMESIFDIGYLVLVIGLGVRLVLSKEKGAGLFGWMAILLGSGDAFHLIPRVMSHLSPGGFAAYQGALSWGKFVTGITMTIFYLLFYFYYQDRSRDRDPKKKWIIFILAAIRIILVCLPENGWGTANESYTMGIVRNIPFALMGMLLIIWTNQKKNEPGLEKMSLLIFLSFLFYIPVVLWVDKIPALGALMLPKTVAYVFIVVQGFRYFIKEFKGINIFDMATTYLIMGLGAGIFYREFTKYFAFTGPTHLAKVHVHTLVLGFIVSMILYLVLKNLENQKLKELKKPLSVYNTGLVLTLVTMMTYGIYDVIGKGQETISIGAISGFSGIGHLLLGVGLVWTWVKIRKAISLEKSVQA